MMATIRSYKALWERKLTPLLRDPRLPLVLRGLGCFVRGFLAAAAALCQQSQTLALALVCAAEPGWPGLVTALAAGLGYLWFWPGSAQQGLVWVGLGVAVQFFAGQSRLARQQKFLLPALCALVPSFTGLWFLWCGLEQTGATVYFLRVALAALACALVQSPPQGLFHRALLQALQVLALAQVRLPGGWCAGFLAAGAMAAGGTFPGAALAGLALDLACITPVPMTAVLSLAFLLALAAEKPLTPVLVPGVYLGVSAVVGAWDVTPMGPLLLGALAGRFLPGARPAPRRRGEAGVAQARLELAALVLQQTQKVLQSTREPELDEQGLLLCALQRACDSCPCRKDCAGRRIGEVFSTDLLHRPYIQKEDLPQGLHCRKSGRLVTELRRAQEQLRHLRRERLRLQEYRSALVRQYQFLENFLQDLSRQLVQPTGGRLARFAPEVGACTGARGRENGDQCAWFAGVGSRYYVLLCDGMGTGAEAQKESADALTMLRRLLQAGFPAQAALKSFNDLCILRGLGGCATADLAQLHLDTGKAELYKWGSAPSYLLQDRGVVTLGVGAPPPGLGDTSAQVERFSLGKEQVLVLTSDGLQPRQVLHRVSTRLDAQELAAMLLSRGRPDPNDDATAVVIRLRPC